MLKRNLLVVDDHPLFRKGILSVVSEEGLFEEIYEASNIKETFDILSTKAVHIITLDLNLPDGDGINIIQKIKKEYNVPILVITTYKSIVLAEKALQKGAMGCISKENISYNLIDALITLLKGGSYIDRIDSVNDLEDKFFMLTPAEKEIFKMLAEGKTAKEIALDTGKSVKTVENQKTSIFNKLGLKNETDLVRLAIRLKIISL
ncbi:MAG: response regulator transcription factor [Calditerrivibrio sp.]|nr:response regulator transcription factor [Calditerrivibrio sp.]